MLRDSWQLLLLGAVIVVCGLAYGVGLSLQRWLEERSRERELKEGRGFEVLTATKPDESTDRTVFKHL